MLRRPIETTPVIDTYLNLQCPATAAGPKRQGVGHFASPQSPQVEAQARPVHPIDLWEPLAKEGHLC